MGWIASLLTFLGLLMNARKVRASWWVWILGDVLWAIHGTAIHDPSITALNVVFIFLNYYGWWKWRPAAIPPAEYYDPECECDYCNEVRASRRTAAEIRDRSGRD